MLQTVCRGAAEHLSDPSIPTARGQEHFLCSSRSGGDWDWGGGGGGYGGAAEAEMDEDEYAQRIWERMEQRKRAASGASAAARQQWGKADEASARRQVR